MLQLVMGSSVNSHNVPNFTGNTIWLCSRKLNHTGQITAVYFKKSEFPGYLYWVKSSKLCTVVINEVNQKRNYC